MTIMSWLFASLTLMLVPVAMGRKIFSVFVAESPRVYELYTSATGLYLTLVLIKGVTLVVSWIQQGWAALSQKMKEWAIIVSSLLFSPKF